VETSVLKTDTVVASLSHPISTNADPICQLIPRKLAGNLELQLKFRNCEFSFKSQNTKTKIKFSNSNHIST